MNASDVQKAYAAWVLGLQPGDRVAVPRRGSAWQAPYDILLVQSVSDALIVMNGGRTFRRTGSPGREVGQPAGPRLVVYSPAIEDAVDEHQLRDWLRELCHRPARVTLVQLRAMKAAYSAAGGAA